MSQFEIPASFLVEAETRDAAVEVVQSMVDFGMDVSNDDGAVLAAGADTPESREVWLVTDRQDSGATENETAVFRTRDAAIAQAKAWIEEYRNDSRVVGEIDAVLEAFDAHAARGDGLFGAGDDACVFWVEVCRFDVRG